MLSQNQVFEFRPDLKKKIEYCKSLPDNGKSLNYWMSELQGIMHNDYYGRVVYFKRDGKWYENDFYSSWKVKHAVSSN